VKEENKMATMKTEKYCTYCGEKMLSETRIVRFSINTGKPETETYYKCPRFEFSKMWGGNNHYSDFPEHYYFYD